VDRKLENDIVKRTPASNTGFASGGVTGKFEVLYPAPRSPRVDRTSSRQPARTQSPKTLSAITFFRYKEDKE